MPGQREGETCIRRVRTIAELAALAGVSAGTVSRALSGSSLVRESTRIRIQALAVEHGFRPNPMARRLRARRGGTVAILVPETVEGRSALQHPGFCAMLAEVLRALDERDCDVALLRAKQGAVDWLERAVDSGAMEGLLMIGRAGDADAVDRLSRSYDPLVVWGFVYPSQQHCAVGVDLERAAMLVMEKLMELGVRHVGVTGDVPGEVLQAIAVQCESVLEGTGGTAELITQKTQSQVDGSPPQGAIKSYDAIIVADDHVSIMSVRPGGDRSDGEETQLAVGIDLRMGAKTLVDCLLARIAGERTSSIAVMPESGGAFKTE